MGEGEWWENRKFDVASLGRKLKLQLLVYIIDYLLLYPSLTITLRLKTIHIKKNHFLTSN